MSSKLRAKRQDLLFVDQIINSNTTSVVVDLGEIESPFSIQLVWESGATPVMSATLEISNDKTNWSEISSSFLNINSTSGTHIWDLTTGAEFIRVSIAVTTGTLTFNAKLNGKVRD